MGLLNTLQKVSVRPLDDFQEAALENLPRVPQDLQDDVVRRRRRRQRQRPLLAAGGASAVRDLREQGSSEWTSCSQDSSHDS